MTRPEKRARERKLLEGMLVQIEVVPDQLRDGPDPPDFLMVVGGRKVAAEVTEFHSDVWRREVEEAWSKFVVVSDHVREQHRELDTVSVDLELARLLLPRRSEYERLANETAEFCLRALPRKSDGYVYRCTAGSGLPLLEQYVDTVRLKRCHGYMHWSSCSLDFAWVGVTQPELKEVVSKKLKPLPDCGVEEAWLFVVGGVHISQVVGLMWPEELNGYREVEAVLRASPYDRVYLCDSEITCWVRGTGWKLVKEL